MKAHWKRFDKWWDAHQLCCEFREPCIREWEHQRQAIENIFNKSLRTRKINWSQVWSDLDDWYNRQDWAAQKRKISELIKKNKIK